MAKGVAGLRMIPFYNIFRMAEGEVATIMGDSHRILVIMACGVVVPRRVPFVFSLEWQKGGCHNSADSLQILLRMAKERLP